MNNDEKKKSFAKVPFVSVIIPAFNESDVIERTVKSVLDSNYPKNKFEILVVDDGSTDDTSKLVKRIQEKYFQVGLLIQKNSGKAAALNNGLNKIKGEFFFCLDADSSVHLETMRRMVGFYYEQYKKYGDRLVIITPSMRVDAPKTFFQKFQRVEYILAAFIQRVMGHIDCIYVAPGPFSMYRTEIIKKSGGFEVGNLTEDQEIAYRMQKNHYIIKQCPDAKVYTIAPRTLKDLFKQRNRWFKGSLYNLFKYKSLLFNKKYGDFGLFQMPLNVINYVLSICALFFFGYFLLIPLIKIIYHLSLIRFDILPYVFNPNISFNILNIDLGKMFVFYTIFSVTIVLFFIAHKYTEERVLQYGVWYLIPYFFVYYFILSIIAIIVLCEVCAGKKQKW